MTDAKKRFLELLTAATEETGIAVVDGCEGAALVAVAPDPEAGYTLEPDGTGLDYKSPITRRLYNHAHWWRAAMGRRGGVPMDIATDWRSAVLYRDAGEVRCLGRVRTVDDLKIKLRPDRRAVLEGDFSPMAMETLCGLAKEDGYTLVRVDESGRETAI